MNEKRVMRTLAEYMGTLPKGNKLWGPHGDGTYSWERQDPLDIESVPLPDYLHDRNALALVWDNVLGDEYINSFDALKAVYVARFGANSSTLFDYELHEWVWLMFATSPQEQAQGLATVIAQSNERRPK